jgi:hypothetical protein
MNRHPGRRLFIAVLERDLGQLRQIARQAGEEIFVVGDDGYEDYREVLLVSTQQTEDFDPRAEGVISSRPSPGTTSEAVFDGTVRLLGADVDPAEARRDGSVTITYYFECLGEMERDGQIFTHVEAVEGGTRWVSDHHPVRSRLPTSMWRRGDLVRDTFTVTVPTGAVSGTYRVMMGFFIGNERWSVTPPSESDGSNRVEALRFTVR